MKCFKNIHTIILLFISLISVGQSDIDSLENLLLQAKKEDQPELLNQLSAAYLRNMPEKSYEYANQALQISQQLKNKKTEADALKNIGDSYYYRYIINKAEDAYQKAQVIYKDINDVSGISDVYASYANIFYTKAELDSAEFYYKRAIELKKDLEDFYGLAKLYSNISFVYMHTGRRSKALGVLNQALELCDKTGNKISEALTLVNIAHIYFQEGVIEKVLEINYKALNVAEEINDQLLISSIYTNLGNIYNFFNDYEKSLEFHLAALNINKEREDKGSVAASLNNIGNVYLEKSQIDSALVFYLESNILYKETNRLHGFAITANNIGEVYFRKGNYDEAITYFEKSLEMSKKAGNEHEIIRNKMNIGSVYLKTKKYKVAKRYIHESLELTQKNEINFKYSIYELLSKLYKETGHFRKALYYHKKYTEEKDSMFSKEKEEAIARINAAHQLERHKQEIEILSKDKALQQQKLEKQKVIQNMFMLVSVFVLALTGLIYYNYRNKIRSNKILSSQNDQIRKKNQEIKHQAYRLSRANHELEKLSIVASKTENAIIIAKPDGTIEWINDGFTRLYGYTYDEFIGTKGKTLEEASANPAIDKIIQKAITEKQSQIYESEIVSKTGERHKLQTTLNPIVDDDGQVIKLVTIDSDISKLKQVEKELQDLVVTKEKFFSIIAHDLKNPFNSLIGLSQLLVHGFDKMKTEKVKYFHQNLYQISKVGYDLLVNLLEWSKSQTGNIKYSPEDINISGVTEETFALYQSKAKQKEILLTNNLDEDSFVYADKNMVKTIFRNLISNALKFTGRGGVIEVSSYKTNSSREISIRDTGVGMKPEDMDKLFRLDTNYTTKGTEDEGGTGLGLVLVKEFIEKNKGFIHVESKPGIGSNFIFTLPAEK